MGKGLYPGQWVTKENTVTLVFVSLPTFTQLTLTHTNTHTRTDTSDNSALHKSKVKEETGKLGHRASAVSSICLNVIKPYRRPLHF